MKILLDENLPRKLQATFSDHETFTVNDIGWKGMKNGELLALLRPSGFEVFLTCDKNIQFHALRENLHIDAERLGPAP